MPGKSFRKIIRQNCEQRIDSDGLSGVESVRADNWEEGYIANSEGRMEGGLKSCGESVSEK